MILLDTHVLAWLVAQPERLSRPAASAIRRARASDGLAIADITLWELAFLFARGTLRTYGTIENTLQNFVACTGVVVRPITAETAALATQFPDDYPKDPVDRLIGATARATGLALVTRDEGIRRCPLLKTIW
jgi:PIN domain nuclease of toxin-antitoxin system